MKPDNLTLAINDVLGRLAQVRARPGLLGGGVSMDNKRPAVWCEYGWPERLEFDDFWSAYARGGLAFGAVERLAGRCWSTNPWVIEGEEAEHADAETAWERRVRAEIPQRRLYREFRRADVLRLVGRYSGLLLHVADSLAWDQPVAAGKALLSVTAVNAGTLTPAEYDDDTSSARYGLPIMWQYSPANPRGPVKNARIHWSRVYVLGDYRDGAVGFLEPAYNTLVNIEKVEGGSGESFLKNAARQLNINFDPEVNLSAIAQAHDVPLHDLQSVYDQVTRALNQGVDTTMVTQGATVSPITSVVPDPTPSYNINLQTLSAAWQIPAKILVGNQTGERASSEDKRDFDERCQARRIDELSFELEDFYQHLIGVRVLPSPPSGRFTVMWDDLTESSTGDKLDSAAKMAAMNGQSPGEPYFSGSEIREVAGYEGEPEPLIFDDDDDDDDSA